MTQPSGGYTVHSDIDSQRQLPPASRRKDLYDTFELRAKVPQGFPSMAAMQMQWSTVGTFRTFEYLDWRRATFYETQLSYLQDLLYKLDVEESKKMKGLQKERVPFNKDNFRDCCLNSSDVSETLLSDDDVSHIEFTILRENIYAHVERISKQHRELVTWLKQASAFPRVHGSLHHQLFRAARELHGLDKQSIEHLRAKDEIAYVSLEPIQERLQNLWRSMPRIRNMLRCVGLRNPLISSNGTQTYEALEVRPFRMLYKALTTLLSSSLVLVPVGVLYLGTLNKTLSFVVVVVSGLAFAIALIIIEQRIGRVIVGVAAYYALLATLLGNTA